MMKILGIDTILHDACVAITDGNKVLSNRIKRKALPLYKDLLLNLTIAHIREIGKLIEAATEESKISLKEISLVAVNNFGSLLSNVMVGLITANTLSMVYNIPIIGVEHQEAHIFSNWIERDPTKFRFPILVFSASGGHNLTALISKNNFKFKKINENKGIKKDLKSNFSFLGIGALFSELVCYLGLKKSKERCQGDGVFISKLAKEGNPIRFSLLRNKQNKQQEKSSINLDCLEIKNNILRIVKKERKENGFLSRIFIADMAASFEDSLADVIVNYLCSAAGEFNAQEIHLVGGVAANTTLRKKLKDKARQLKIVGRWPVKKSYCTDNAAMIANLGYLKFKQNPRRYLKQRDVLPRSDLILENIAVRQFLEKGKLLV